ncbi:MAG: IPT/TIG domain-containing protein [Acidobacteriota bacterium]
MLVAIALFTGCSSSNPTYKLNTLTPSEVTAGSNDFVLLLNGANFKSDTTVLFGSLSLPAKLVNSGTLQVLVPASAVTTAGTIDVAVTGSPTSAPLTFTVNNPLPAVSSLSTSEVLLNTSSVSLDVTGSNFVSTSTAQLGDVSITPSAITATHLTLAVPDALLTKAQVLNLSIVNPGPGGGASNAVNFSVLNPVPALAALSLESAVLNSTSLVLDVSGENFLPTSVLTFGSTTLTPASISPTHMTVAIPDTLLASAQVFDVAVASPGPGGGTSAKLAFSVLNPVPAITSMSVEEAVLNSADLEVVISGTGFAPGMKVNFGPNAVEPTTITSTTATVVIPKRLFGKAAINDVTVANGGPGGGTSNAHRFTIKNPQPSLASLSVTKTLVGSDDLTLSLAGSGFVSGESTVRFGTLNLTPVSTADDQLSIVVPKAALAQSGIVQVGVDTGGPGGGQSNLLEFAVENPVPTLTALSANGLTAGAPAFDLTISGTNFVPGSIVSFGGLQLTPAAVAAAEMTVTIPAESLLDAGELAVAVTNPGPGGGASNALPFTISNPLPTLASVSPTTAIRLSSDTTLTLTGSGFVHQSTVQLGTATLVPASYTDTQITLLIPVGSLSQTGPLDLTVSNPAPGGGTSAALQISVVNPRPHLGSASPSSITTSTANATLVLKGSGFNEDTTVTMTSAASGTTTLPIVSYESNVLTLSIPSVDLGPGTLTFTAENPTPGGGGSETMSVVIHERAQNTWRTVVNNKVTVPDAEGQLFNSYNQPSVSGHGTVVFKGQSKGQSGPTVGIYLRDMSGDGFPIVGRAAKGMAVPEPNNTFYNGSKAGFIQFPSFPRIDIDTENIAVRGQSKPVYTYTTTDGLESRLGSAGVYTTAGGGELKTGVSLLGSLPDFEYMKVPSAGGTRFDQFPGSPAIYHNQVVFKGNYTVGDTGKTGVYFRDVVPDPETGEYAVQRIADSDTLIPGQPEGGTVFGSTAPPSAANGNMVFVGLDNEDAPTLGGIYLAPLAPNPPLTTLVSVGSSGTRVPGEAPGVTFNRLGEGLSFDGRYVAFWAAWGPETRTRTLICGVDGNQEMLDSCRATYPDGFSTEIPIHQGIFVYDTQASENPLTAIAKTDSGEFTDFLYWVFSGRPPNVGDTTGNGSGGSGEDGDSGGDVPGSDEIPEPPRWRSSAFVSVDAAPSMGPGQDGFVVAFKATADSSDGIYLAHSSDLSRVQTVVDTTTTATDIDSEAPAGSLITTVGMERDGLRNNRLVLTSSMLNSETTESNAGIYITPVQPLVAPPQP